MLSKASEWKWHLDRLGHQRQNIEWMIDPFPQITVGKEIPSEKGNQIGERSPEPGLKIEGI
jgi:hypothetical protein